MAEKTTRLTVDIIARLKSLTTGLRSAASSIRKWGAEVGREMIRLAKKVAIVGAAMTAAAAAFGVLAVRKSVRAFAELERKVVEIGTLLKDWSPKVFRQITDEAKRLAIQFGQTTEAVLGAKYDVVSAGFLSTAESGAILETGMKAATAGLVDANTAIGLLITGLRGYQMSVKEVRRVSDVFFTTVRLGRTTFGELAAYLGTTIPTAKAAGVSLEELGAAMATVTLGGIDTATAAVSLNQMFLAMTAPADNATEAMQRMGIVTKDATGRMLGMLQVVKQFAGKPLADIVEVAGSVRAARALLAMANNVRLLDANLKEFRNTSGATEDAFNKMADTLDFRFRQRKAVGAAFWQDLGEILRPVALDYIQKMTTVFQAMRVLIRKNKELIKTEAQEVLNWLWSSAQAAWGELKTGIGWVDYAINVVRTGIYAIYKLAYPLGKFVISTIMYAASAAGDAVSKIQLSIEGGILSIKQMITQQTAWLSPFLGMFGFAGAAAGKAVGGMRMTPAEQFRLRQISGMQVALGMGGSPATMQWQRRAFGLQGEDLKEWVRAAQEWQTLAKQGYVEPAFISGLKDVMDLMSDPRNMQKVLADGLPGAKTAVMSAYEDILKEAATIFQQQLFQTFIPMVENAFVQARGFAEQLFTQTQPGAQPVQAGAAAAAGAYSGQGLPRVWGSQSWRNIPGYRGLSGQYPKGTTQPVVQVVVNARVLDQRTIDEIAVAVERGLQLGYIRTYSR